MVNSEAAAVVDECLVVGEDDLGAVSGCSGRGEAGCCGVGGVRRCAVDPVTDGGW